MCFAEPEELVKELRILKRETCDMKRVGTKTIEAFWMIS